MEKLSILLLGNEDRDIFTRLFEEGKFESDMMVAEDTANPEECLNAQWVLPDVVVIKLKNMQQDLRTIETIRNNKRFDTVILLVYSESIDAGFEEQVFLAGANIFIQKIDEIQFKRKTGYILSVIWQYIADGFNKETFMLMVN